MKFTDTAELAGTRRTADGYLVADVLCARMGCQDYQGTDLGLTDAGMVPVFRPESVVFDKASMATFAGKPVTVGHPADPVTADNWKNYAVGDIGEDVARDGESIRVSIKVMDAVAIKAIEGGTQQISMGYTTGIEMKDGTAPDGTKYRAVQVGPIRINHLAIVDRARGGDKLRIGDGAESWGAAPFTMSKKEEDSMSNQALTTVVLGDKAAQVAVADAPLIEQFKIDQAKALSDMQTAHVAEIAAKDEDIGKLKAANKKMADEAITPEKMTGLIADRVALEATVKLVSDTIKVEGVSDADLRKAAVTAKFGDDMVTGEAEATITGMFKAVAKDVAKSDSVADIITGGIKASDSESVADKAYNDNLAYLNGAHRQEKGA